MLENYQVMLIFVAGMLAGGIFAIIPVKKDLDLARIMNKPLRRQTLQSANR